MKIRFLRDTELLAGGCYPCSTVTFEKGEEVEVASIKDSKYASDMYNIILLDGRETSDIKENIEILS
jgi:hypothetical protein